MTSGLKWLIHGDIHDRDERVLRLVAGMMCAAATIGFLALVGIMTWMIVTAT